MKSLMLLVIVLIATAQISEGQLPGLTHWWKGEGNALDEVSGSSGALANGLSFAPGVAGDAFLFDGQDNMVLFGDDEFIGNGNDPFTIGFWVQPTAKPNSYFHVIRFRQDTQFLFCIISDSFGLSGDWIAPLFRGNTDQWYTPIDLDSMLNGWTHLAVTYNGGDKNDATSFIVYANGVALPQGTVNLGSVGGECNDSGFGADVGDAACSQINPGTAFSGLMDEIKVFDRALSSGEVATLASNDLAETRLHLKFNEGVGTTTSDSSSFLHQGTFFGSGVSFNGDTYCGQDYGSSVQFDGQTGNAIVFPDDESLRLTDGITVEALIKRHSSWANGAIVGRQYGASGIDAFRNSYQIGQGGGLIWWGITDSSGQSFTATATVNFDDEDWHHVAGVWDRSNLLIYLDYQLIATTPAVGTGFLGYQTSNPVLVGSDDDGIGIGAVVPYQGLIDEIRVTSGALEPVAFIGDCQCENDIAALIEQIAQLSADNTGLTTQNTQLAADNAGLTTQNTQLAADNAGLTTQNTQLAADNAGLTTQNTQLAADNTQLALDNAALTNEIGSLNGELSECVDQVDALLEEFDLAAAHLEGIEAYLGDKFGDEDFIIEGGTVSEVLETLSLGIANLNKGHAKALYDELQDLQVPNIDGAREAAQEAIDAAITGGGKQKEIDKAEREMEKALEELAKGHFDHAIDKYSKALKHALKALG